VLPYEKEPFHFMFWLVLSLSIVLNLDFLWAKRVVLQKSKTESNSAFFIVQIEKLFNKDKFYEHLAIKNNNEQLENRSSNLNYVLV
tara:strand:+ start:271 stop:528 length:258 start_codon:yes stop_codon:yes gene_type:complete